jgi:HK97 family phage major capsid protein
VNRIQQFKERRKALLEECKALAEKVQAEGREFFPHEQTEIQAKTAEAKSLEKAIAQEESDDELRKAIGALTAPLGLGLDGTTSRRKHSNSVWGTTVLQGLGRAGIKSLTPSGSITVPSLSSTIVGMGDRPRTVLQAVPTEPLGGTDSFSYLRETVRTHNAAPVAVGALKPTSIYSLVRVDDTVKTIAHLSEPIARQTLADAAMLEEYIDDSLRVGCELGLESQIVSGNGTGANLLGLLETPDTLAQGWVTDLLTTTRKALTLLTQGGDIAGGEYCIHPNDWERFDLLVDLAGDFFTGGPLDITRRILWGQPVLVSAAVPEGTGLLVDFAGSTQLFEREGVQIDWSENIYRADALGSGGGASDFELNQVTFRGEGRWGFAVKRPRGVVEIDLTEAS